MSKQDRQGVRTPAGLERKYPLGDIERNKSNANNQNVLLNQLRNDLATYKKSVNGDIEKINQFMDEANAKFDDLEENDKMWFYSGVPTLENYPADEWTTDELKAKHMGDMYCDVDNGNMYIFKKIAEAYLWQSCLSGGCDVDHEALYNNGYTEGHTKGYNDGHQKGYTEGETAGYNKGYADGQSSGTDAPNLLEYATAMRETFKGVAFPTEYEITLVLPQATSFVSAFHDASGIKRAIIKGNTNGSVVDFNAMYRNCRSIETIDLTEFNAKPNSVYLAFYYCDALKYIYGDLDFSECTNTTNWLQSCKELEEIRFKANSIKISISFAQSLKLSAQSVQSIIDGLATVETAQTITFHASIVLTDEQKATISSKNWTLVQ